MSFAMCKRRCVVIDFGEEQERQAQCDKCGDSKIIPVIEPCFACQGKGKTPDGKTCRICKGSGKYRGAKPCPKCIAEGRLSEDSIDID